ncbi:MAG: sigma-70 family RNA polymerase sigma factor [bacterium]|nr:sigma-70 family RNA polymerase sigma factor [bacterium]
MAAVAAGEMAALGQLVRRHQARALRLARRVMGRDELAEDVVQEAFLRVYRAAAKYRPEARFTTWLHRIVVNLCFDQRRRWVPPPAGVDPTDQQQEARETDPADRSVTDETRQAVRRAVATLPDRQRLAVILHRFEGYSMREVAQVTGWSVSAVESCLVRAYRRLRHKLAGLRVDSQEKNRRPGDPNALHK